MNDEQENEAASIDGADASATAASGPIGILTAGGDAPGMNAAIRAVVRAAVNAEIYVFGFRRGYDGLIKDLAEPLSGRSVANIVQRGGTFLETSRSDDFRSREGRARAANNLKRRGISALIVIGGEGSIVGATVFANETGVRVFAVPASIDNDIPATDFSIGFDTAVNTALEAIDRIRDTAFAYERVFCIEVMGRDSGFIALEVAIGGGAEAVVVPEIPVNLDDICNRVEESHRRGKRSSIIVVSEGPRTGGVMPVAAALTERLKVNARVVVLGHVQRGGAPTARDRLLASRMGIEAVKAILEGEASSLIAETRGEIVRIPLAEAAARERKLDSSLIDLVHQLST
ncbi:MAG: 6-phosphofructokinase [Candidatus Binatus sp.]|uniref:6-phosphofructokinase n=1 Tax=Candidatus Binatus sp. TaxID=2811406 RepID=UPI0027287411|nr:6-phosphofructokinase [Candidatus Binatus sp.]MDO8432724.1 6-phosphofructokinase [Candidatus Binatus sp.]